MRKTKQRNETKPTITFDQLAKMEKIPEIPQRYRDQLWRSVRVKKEVLLSEECDHFLNMLCMHFGMARNDVLGHAINLLWKEVVGTISTERLHLYEEKLEAMRLYRLYQNEGKSARKAEKIQNAMKDWKDENPEGKHRSYGECVTWTYQHDQPVRRKPHWMQVNKPFVRKKPKAERGEGE